ncbi:MAG: hypothetical protein ABIV11_05900, partial [Gemmatimonadaceae bacterium]
MPFSLPRSVRRGQLSLYFAATVLVTSPGWGQPGPTLTGVVTDPDGLAILGAVVSVSNTSLASKTDERGEF